MFDNQQLFAEIVPSKEANLSGGCGGYGGYGGYKRNPRYNSRHQPKINVEAVATVDILGLEQEPTSSIVSTSSDVFVNSRGIFARAVSLIRIIF
ncbi:MAG: hypothetical protein WBM44_02350 [Waterburya sp.]